MLIFADSGSGKTNVLLNWIEEQGSDSPIEKIYSYAKNLSELKYRFLIKTRENVGPKRLHDPKSFWWLQLNKKEKDFNCVWWHDCWYYD